MFSFFPMQEIEILHSKLAKEQVKGDNRKRNKDTKLSRTKYFEKERTTFITQNKVWLYFDVCLFNFIL